MSDLKLLTKSQKLLKTFWLIWAIAPKVKHLIAGPIMQGTMSQVIADGRLLANRREIQGGIALRLRQRRTLRYWRYAA